MKAITQQSEVVTTGLCVLKFGATWCGPCKRLEPVVEKLADEFTDVTFLTIDIDDAREMGKDYNVRSVPTLVFLKDGVEFKRHSGLSLIDPLRKILREAQPATDEK